jgi:hypothetical protein
VRKASGGASSTTGGAVSACSDTQLRVIATYPTEMTVSGAATLTDGNVGTCSINYTGSDALTSNIPTFSVMGSN